MGTAPVVVAPDGLSAYEISARLAAEGTPLNRTGVGQLLAEEGFGRLLRHPGPEGSISPATAGRATNLPPAKVTGFAAFPAGPAPGSPADKGSGGLGVAGSGMGAQMGARSARICSRPCGL